MKKKYDATAIIGKYTKDGKEKNRYLTIGSVLEREDGSMCLKLDAVPTNFDGWINFYEPKFKELADSIENKKPIPDDEEIPF